MVLGFAERYSFEKHEDRVVLLMQQRAHGLRLGVVETVIYWSKSIKRIRRGRPLRLWLETIVDAGEGVMFPYRVHFLDADGHVAGLFVEFQRRGSVDEMRCALQTAITLDVTDEKPSN